MGDNMSLINDIIDILKRDYNNMKVIKSFENANCNTVYLLEDNTNKYVLKIATKSIRISELKKEYNIINNIDKSINVPKVYKYFEDKDYAYILMEYIDGISLENLLKEKDNKDIILFELGKLLKNINSINIPDKEPGEYYLNKQLEKAYNNMQKGLLDKEEFLINKVQVDQTKLLKTLKENIPKDINISFLHGDFRPKNIIYSNNKYYIIDFGLSHIGDYYYDLAIFFYYLNKGERHDFLLGYGINDIDENKLQYYEYLSKYLNV